MRQRDSGKGWSGDCGSNAGHHFEFDTGGGKGLGFLATTPEDERVATLETNHPFAHAHLVDEKLINLALIKLLFAAALFSRVNTKRTFRREPQDFRIREVIVDDDIRESHH